ncbi:MAG: S-layer homology domain-containing protein [Thermacetogeniaceae bacterium]
MNKRKSLLWLFFCVVVLLLICYLPARAWLAGSAEASGQPAAGPGSAADPVLSVNSLEQYLKQLFTDQNQQLDSLQARLNLVSQELQAIQGKTGAPFPDLYGHWAAGAVSTLKNREVVSGYPDGNYHPEDRVTRAAMAVMLTRIKNLLSNPGAAGFPDVPSSYWAAGAIGAARAAGYLQGYADGTFHPEQGVSRAEAAALLEKAFSPQGSATVVNYTDVSSSYWAAGAINHLASAGVVSGYPDGTFHPERIVSRAEAAALLNRVLLPQ